MPLALTPSTCSPRLLCEAIRLAAFAIRTMLVGDGIRLAVLALAICLCTSSMLIAKRSFFLSQLSRATPSAPPSSQFPSSSPLPVSPNVSMHMPRCCPSPVDDPGLVDTEGRSIPTSHTVFSLTSHSFLCEPWCRWRCQRRADPFRVLPAHELVSPKSSTKASVRHESDSIEALVQPRQFARELVGDPAVTLVSSNCLCNAPVVDARMHQIATPKPW